MLVRLAFLIPALVGLTSQASDRPFWTEKSQYIEGDRVYFVGVASNAKTIEEGREKALKNAEKEMQNYFKMSDIKGFEFSTQMTFEEDLKDGKFNIFRLMYITKETIKVAAEKKEADIQAAKLTEDEITHFNQIVKVFTSDSDRIKEKLKFVKKGMTGQELRWIMGDATFYDEGDRIYYRECYVRIRRGLVFEVGPNCKS